jgi:hypothetical protein
MFGKGETIGLCKTLTVGVRKRATFEVCLTSSQPTVFVSAR